MDEQVITQILTDISNTFFVPLAVIFVIFLIKDYLSVLASGVIFYFSSGLSCGDVVELDNETVLVLDVGVASSRFLSLPIEEGIKIRAVPNEKMKNLKLVLLRDYQLNKK